MSALLMELVAVGKKTTEDLYFGLIKFSPEKIKEEIAARILTINKGLRQRITLTSKLVDSIKVDSLAF